MTDAGLAFPAGHFGWHLALGSEVGRVCLCDSDVVCCVGVALVVIDVIVLQNSATK